MTIIWRGQSCFQILTFGHKREQVSIVIDPFEENLGLRVPKLKANILLITHSHPDHNNIRAIEGNPFLISGPGEYEIKNIFIQGIVSFHDNKKGKARGENTIYTIEDEDLKLCHLGDLGQRELTGEQLERIGEIDILFIPIGGTYTISAKEAIKVMSQIEPKITIPMHYQLPKLKIKLDRIDNFLKLLGTKSIEPQPKLWLKKKDLSEDEAKIVVLRP